LGGEHHRDEKLERIRELQRDRGVLVLGGKALDDRAYPRALRTEALARLVDVTARHV